MLLLAAGSEFLTGVDALLAHRAAGPLHGGEWIPAVFGPLAGLALVLAGILAFRRRTFASLTATIVFLLSTGVGVLGAYYHFLRAVLPHGPVGQRVVFDLFFWAPPVLGPLAFAFIGIFGTSAAWIEDPPNSGRLLLPAGLRLQLPYPKTNAYFYIASMGILIALISAALDHAATGLHNPWLWLPLAAGVFGTVVALVLGMTEEPAPADIWTYVAAMLLLMAVGAIGAFLHVRHDLATGGHVVPERFLVGAPFMAPLLFSNMGLVGLIALLPHYPNSHPIPTRRFGKRR